MNLPEAVQADLGYPPLSKFNVNTQEVKNSNTNPEDKFSQAAIPTVLIGLYKYSLTDTGASAILSTNISSNWVMEIFPGYNYDIVDRIAGYSGEDKDSTHAKLNTIAQTAVAEVRKAVAPGNQILDVKKFLSDQKINMYLYLPEALHIGQLLDDTTVDDKTKKMEGPVSNLIKAVGDAFSKPDKDETIDKEI